MEFAIAGIHSHELCSIDQCNQIFGVHFQIVCTIITLKSGKHLLICIQRCGYCNKELLYVDIRQLGQFFIVPFVKCGFQLFGVNLIPYSLPFFGLEHLRKDGKKIANRNAGTANVQLAVQIAHIRPFIFLFCIRQSKLHIVANRIHNYFECAGQGHTILIRSSAAVHCDRKRLVTFLHQQVIKGH